MRYRLDQRLLSGPALRFAALLALWHPAWAGAQESGRPMDCIIEARQTVEIRSPVEALIESVKVQRGDLVSRGQVIATLQSGPERAALDLARTRATSVGEIKVAEARVGITQKKLKRAEDLFAQNFISENARDEARADFQLATEDLGRTRENQKLAEQEVKRAAEVLALRTITSPFTGKKPGYLYVEPPANKLEQITDPNRTPLIFELGPDGKPDKDGAILWAGFAIGMASGLPMRELMTFDAKEGGQLAAVVIGAAIWIPYILKSQRVRNTFTR